MSQRADFRHSGEEAQLEVNLFASGSKYMMINSTLWLQDKQKPDWLWQLRTFIQQRAISKCTWLIDFRGDYGDISASSATLLCFFFCFWDGAVQLFQLSENQKRFTTAQEKLLPLEVWQRVKRMSNHPPPPSGAASNELRRFFIPP